MPGMFGEHCSPLLVVNVTNSAADPDPDPLVRAIFISNKGNLHYVVFEEAHTFFAVVFLSPAPLSPAITIHSTFLTSL